MLRVGLIGLGAVGRRRAAAIQAHPGLRLVETSDSPAQTTQLLTASLDLVFVCVPNDQTAPTCLAALSRGLHVFCEKPPARSLAELLPVVQAATAADRVLMYGFNHRLHGAVLRLRELAGSQEHGALRSLRGVYGKPGATGWRRDPAVAGGGILLDQGIHMLDLLRLLAGELTVEGAVVRGAPLEEDVHALLRGERGVVASLHSSAWEPRCTFRLEAVFERARVVVDGILSGSMAYAPERLRVEAQGRPPTEERFEQDGSWAAEVDAMAAAVVEGRSAAAAGHGSPEDAVALMRCIERIHQAGRA